MMKSCISKTISVVFCLIFSAVLMLGVFSFTKFDNAMADYTPFSSETISDTNFSVRLQVAGREATAIGMERATITNTVGNDETYLCFKWRDLKRLNFTVNGLFQQNSSTLFNDFDISMTYAQSDDLSSMIEAEQTLPKSLFPNEIQANSFQPSTLFFYIDQNADTEGLSNAKTGFGFGLYRFTFSYHFTKDNKQHPASLDTFNIAVIPDDIDEITTDAIKANNVQILRQVRSSQMLMNTYNLWLSSDLFTYVNPKYIEWQVVGKDIENTTYVLNESMRKGEYTNSKAIWDTIDTPAIGTSFLFDSKNIEGTWNVTCLIKSKANPEAGPRAMFTANDLSTIKVAPKSYLWLIILLIILAILIVVAVVCIILYIKKKHEKVW